MHQHISALYSQKFSFQFQNWPNHHFIYESVYTFTHAMFSDIVYCRCTWTKRREKGHFTWLLVMKTYYFLYACLNKDIALSCYIIHTLCHWVGLTHYPRSNSKVIYDFVSKTCDTGTVVDSWHFFWSVICRHSVVSGARDYPQLAEYFSDG